MSFDVNKIIEESVKDVIDDDKNDNLLEENQNLDPENLEEGKKDGDDFEEVYTESVDYFKEYFKEDDSKK